MHQASTPRLLRFPHWHSRRLLFPEEVKRFNQYLTGGVTDAQLLGAMCNHFPADTARVIRAAWASAPRLLARRRSGCSYCSRPADKIPVLTHGHVQWLQHIAHALRGRYQQRCPHTMAVNASRQRHRILCALEAHPSGIRFSVMVLTAPNSLREGIRLGKRHPVTLPGSLGRPIGAWLPSGYVAELGYHDQTTRQQQRNGALFCQPQFQRAVLTLLKGFSELQLRTYYLQAEVWIAKPPADEPRDVRKTVDALLMIDRLTSHIFGNTRGAVAV